MNEREAAIAMAEGRIPSPARIGDLTLVKMRITGSGMSYRSGLKEYVWREPEIFATQEFADRCNGIPVVYEHTNDQNEIVERIMGTVIYPYVDGDEVWGIVRIFLKSDIDMMVGSHPSTSPCVAFLDPAELNVTKLPSGEVVRIEGRPTIIDHLAVVPLGVWDKGTDPKGIRMNQA